MRFNELVYLHAEEFEDKTEIQFAGDFDQGLADIWTVELWIQDGNINVVIVDEETNKVSHVSEEERSFAINYARKLKLIQ